jgi:aryl-alcohol dehydrogenase-like predicted oxidoreductase
VETASQQGWSESWDAYANERTWTVLDALFAMADETGKSASQVALRWLLQKPGVTAPIVGARTLQHLESNLGATGWELTQDQMERLDDVSEMKAPYPIASIRGSKRRG